MIEFYWVEFDEPQIGGDGDGPCATSEIDADYLDKIADDVADDTGEMDVL